ncbi:uncharacterized protein LOC110878666 [Helianthus annuus]|uniref:uncharacterized protein LOC110878666 n=1 Tax=Helianthus annuus TaxID=4232 RepID=UPI00165325ED|nr:uncharacterized protein LOC110878666 [Helianthus annuus]
MEKKSNDTFIDGNQPQTPPRTESEDICHLFSHISTVDYIGSCGGVEEEQRQYDGGVARYEESSVSSDGNSQQLSRERVKLLANPSDDCETTSFKCFSVSDLKKKVRASIGNGFL